MKRAIPMVLAVLSAASSAFAQAEAPEGGQVRTGEHDGFSRIVLQVDPKTEWSLESTPDQATVTFPGKPIKFDTTGVFDRMQANRVKSITSKVGEKGTTVSVDLGCDCRVSTSYVGARYLAIDVADRTEPPAPVAETPEERDARETRTVNSAQDALLRQIERAADQGIIKLTEPLPTPPEVAAPEAVAEVTQPQAPAAVEESPKPSTPAQIETRGAEQIAPLADLLDSDQIQATTVFDRDRRAAAARMAKIPTPPECLPDDMFDLASWSDNRPLYEQVPELNQKMLGEFDTPSPETIAELARLYIRFGFGTEAEGLMRSIGSDFPDRKLLIDLSHAIEGRPIAPGGPLSVQTACPGRHGLWLAVGGAAPAYQNPDHFKTVQSAFAELTPDLRLTIGPKLIVRLLDAGHPAEARLIYDTIVRPGGEGSVDLDLSEALLVAAEGHPLAGAQALNQLVDENAPNGVDALARLTRLIINSDLPMPKNLVIDLRAAAHESRGAANETDLRALLSEALARTGALGDAMTELRTTEKELPESAPRMDALAVALMAEADPAKVGGPAYAETVLGEIDRIGTAPANDSGRVAIARGLLDLSLPDAALKVLQPALDRGMPEARIAASDAHIKLGQPDLAQADLAGLDGPQVAELRAKSMAKKGDYATAAQELDKAGLDKEATAYAWPSGNWPKAEATTEDPNQKAMATYMANRGGAAVVPPPPPGDPNKPNPAQAFNEPLPTLDQPSLDSARRLLATGQQVQGFIQDVLTPPPPAAAPPAN